MKQWLQVYIFKTVCVAHSYLSNKCLVYHISSILALSPKLHMKLNCLKKCLAAT